MRKKAGVRHLCIGFTFQIRIYLLGQTVPRATCNNTLDTFGHLKYSVTQQFIQLTASGMSHRSSNMQAAICNNRSFSLLIDCADCFVNQTSEIRVLSVMWLTTCCITDYITTYDFTHCQHFNSSQLTRAVKTYWAERSDRANNSDCSCYISMKTKCKHS